MVTKNNIHTISRNRAKKAVFDICLDEACRQWCCFIEDAPERRNGEGFARFFYEIFDDKWKSYFDELPMKNNNPKSQIKYKSETER